MAFSELDTLRKYWGYESFRPMQEDIVRSVLDGNDTLGLMPTGGGKSITFQVPGMMLPGLTVVVTPLVSLMKDQVDHLLEKGIRAVCLHSGLSSREIRIAREKLENGNCKFLYLAPERLANPRMLADIRMLDVSLVVVDEAHCISQWGYDFRPAYLNIAGIRKVCPGVPLLALTATATPHVAQDIMCNLEMTNPRVFRMGFSRPNLQYVVRKTEDKYSQIEHILKHTQGSAIVYVRNRKRTREISDFLNGRNIPATYYHARLDIEEKDLRQDRWKNGEVRVIVATNAFGMGIDKPDVRVVIHHDLPPSLEEYYQEAGRAGRDGLRSFAVLLAGKSDKGVLKRRIKEAYPDRKDILKVYERVGNFLNVSLGEGYGKLYEFDLDEFCRRFEYKEQPVVSSLKILSTAGYLDYYEENDTRSRLMVVCSRTALYNMDVSEEAEIVLETVLRRYPGLFADYVFISEGALARSLGITEREVYEALKELTRRHYIHYVPKKRTALIGYPTSREEPKYLVIGREAYEDRREALKTRIDAMVDYAYGDDSCRVRRMLAYFGDETGEDCGKCDVCLARRKSPRAGRRRLLADTVLSLLDTSREPMDFDTLLRRIGCGEDELRDAVRSLTEDERIVCDRMGQYRID